MAMSICRPPSSSTKPWTSISPASPIFISPRSIWKRRASAIHWEPSRGGALFPHLYGPLLLETVIAYGPMERDDQGKVRLPVAG